MVPKPTTAAESALRMTVATEAIMETARVAVKVARKTEAKAEAARTCQREGTGVEMSPLAFPHQFKLTSSPRGLPGPLA
jgi:hypothetical protein